MLWLAGGAGGVLPLLAESILLPDEDGNYQPFFQWRAGIWVNLPRIF
ncbi:MAG: hypothetical protein ACLR2G_01800 [Phascolarctobacterium faecium]